MRNFEVCGGEVRRVPSRAVVGLALIGLVNGGCFAYAPVAFESVKSNEDVRVRVTDDAAARLSKDLGAFATEIDGELAPQRHDSVSITVTIDRAYKGTTIGTTTQQLFVARSEIVEVRRREFSTPRTILLSAGMVAGFGALAAGIAQLVDPNGPSDSQPTAPPPPQLRRPPRTHFGVRIPIP
jgi:hypothetical protein